MKIFCFMSSGKNLTEEICDVLFENAHEMIHYGRRTWPFACGTKYDGMIESDLEPVDFPGGFEIIAFTAELVFKPVGYTKVRFGIRATDLEHMSQARWGRVRFR